MTRAEMEQYILDTYAVAADYPWQDDAEDAVFRHESNRKWFALAMTVERRRLGLEGEGTIDIVNMKCDPVLIASLTGTPGFFPAYHMNKEKWITAALDGSAPDETIRVLLDMSFDATAPKIKKRKRAEEK